MGLPDGWFSALPLDLERLRERRLLDERFLLLDRLRSFLRRERLRLLLRERLLLPSSAFSWLFERERLLLLETELASESSSRAIFWLAVSRRRRLRVPVRAVWILLRCYATRLREL